MLLDDTATDLELQSVAAAQNLYVLHDAEVDRYYVELLAKPDGRPAELCLVLAHVSRAEVIAYLNACHVPHVTLTPAGVLASIRKGRALQ